MGSGHSIFGQPRRCNNCGKCKLGDCVWYIKYESTIVDDYQKNNETPNNMPNFNFFEMITFASGEADKIKDIVGKISISYSIDKIEMEQYLCDLCNTSVRNIIDKLPEEWGYEGHYNIRGYEKIELP